MEKKTPLYDRHVALGGKIVPFAGYLLPVQYPTGVIAEHMAVRTAAGLFDVSHMGELVFTGPDALKNLNHMLTNDFTNMTDGQVRYSPMCNDAGGCVDDLIVYKVREGAYLVVVNAANKDKDAAWKFLRSFLTEEYQERVDYLPTNKNAFDKQLKKAMEVKYEKDANGNYILDENGERKPVSMGIASDGVNTYEIFATSPRQAEQLREVIATASKMMDYDKSIINIVLEQAAAYFAGQKSAQDVAKLIQSKANIYINEQR